VPVEQRRAGVRHAQNVERFGRLRVAEQRLHVKRLADFGALGHGAGQREGVAPRRRREHHGTFERVVPEELVVREFVQLCRYRRAAEVRAERAVALARERAEPRRVLRTPAADRGQVNRNARRFVRGENGGDVPRVRRAHGRGS